MRKTIIPVKDLVRIILIALSPLILGLIFPRLPEKEVIFTIIKNKKVEHDKNMKFWKGEASYYSREGCLNCDENLIMANGEPLDDYAYAIAFDKLPLGSKVRIVNNENFNVAHVEITDRKGSDDRIADMTIATKEALGCNDLCDVTIIYDGEK